MGNVTFTIDAELGKFLQGVAQGVASLKKLEGTAKDINNQFTGTNKSIEGMFKSIKGYGMEVLGVLGVGGGIAGAISLIRSGIAGVNQEIEDSRKKFQEFSSQAQNAKTMFAQQGGAPSTANLLANYGQLIQYRNVAATPMQIQQTINSARIANPNLNYNQIYGMVQSAAPGIAAMPGSANPLENIVTAKAQFKKTFPNLSDLQLNNLVAQVINVAPGAMEKFEENTAELSMLKQLGPEAALGLTGAALKKARSTSKLSELVSKLIAGKAEITALPRSDELRASVTNPLSPDAQYKMSAASLIDRYGDDPLTLWKMVEKQPQLRSIIFGSNAKPETMLPKLEFSKLRTPKERWEWTIRQYQQGNQRALTSVFESGGPKVLELVMPEYPQMVSRFTGAMNAPGDQLKALGNMALKDPDTKELMTSKKLEAESAFFDLSQSRHDIKRDNIKKAYLNIVKEYYKDRPHTMSQLTTEAMAEKAVSWAISTLPANATEGEIRSHLAAWMTGKISTFGAMLGGAYEQVGEMLRKHPYQTTALGIGVGVGTIYSGKKAYNLLRGKEKFDFRIFKPGHPNAPKPFGKIYTTQEFLADYTGTAFDKTQTTRLAEEAKATQEYFRIQQLREFEAEEQAVKRAQEGLKTAKPKPRGGGKLFAISDLVAMPMLAEDIRKSYLEEQIALREKQYGGIFSRSQMAPPPGALINESGEWVAPKGDFEKMFSFLGEKIGKAIEKGIDVYYQKLWGGKDERSKFLATQTAATQMGMVYPKNP